MEEILRPHLLVQSHNQTYQHKEQPMEAFIGLAQMKHTSYKEGALNTLFMHNN